MKERILPKASSYARAEAELGRLRQRLSEFDSRSRTVSIRWDTGLGTFSTMELTDDPAILAIVRGKLVLQVQQAQSVADVAFKELEEEFDEAKSQSVLSSVGDGGRATT